ncbi:MAG: NADPH:quinone oxidoreductase family protein [Actinobacteria bacterium]|nr:MAG: NADPH:quinone oxidoreductase family protein [Actinomycetota bacterium]
MQVVVCNQVGSLDQLAVEERPSPDLYPTCVRIAVTACGVNYVDALFVQGKYQIKPPTPFIPGMEIVGRVTEVASDVAGINIGDRVFANIGLGGFTSEAVVAASRVVVLPESLTDGQAATFMQSYLTGWFALVDRAKVETGKWLLVLGGGGGVGLAAVDLGHTLGLRVIAVASTVEKRALATARGAHAVIDSTLSANEIKEQAKQISGGGVDYIYDPVGGEVGETCLRALTDDGQYLVIGFVAGIPMLPANQILLRNRRITGVDWGAWAMKNPELNNANLAKVLELIGEGKLRPVEPVTYPLRDAARALTDIQARKIAGKVALIP